MIIRIVKMEFKNEYINDFQNMFDSVKDKIAGSEGCQHLELLNDISNPQIFFTYSIWKHEKYLEKYRQSELFSKVWSKTKTWFSKQPEAWSLEKF